MSYELADGSMSTDYKIGDEFTCSETEGLYSFEEDDGSEFPFFSVFTGGSKSYCSAHHWEYLTPIKKKNTNKDLIELMRSTLEQLELNIKELER